MIDRLLPSLQPRHFHSWAGSRRASVRMPNFVSYGPGVVKSDKRRGFFLASWQRDMSFLDGAVPNSRAEQHIALGKEQINNQYRIIAKLESNGHDTAAAVELPKQFIETQQDNEQDRDRLMSKLANPS